jgi:hypothetical protein
LARAKLVMMPIDLNFAKWTIFAKRTRVIFR